MKNYKRQVEEAQEAINEFTNNVTVHAVTVDGQSDIVGQYPNGGRVVGYSAQLSRYFNMDLFVSYFRGRADWLNASDETRQHCTDNGIHPQRYKIN